MNPWLKSVNESIALLTFSFRSRNMAHINVKLMRSTVGKTYSFFCVSRHFIALVRGAQPSHNHEGHQKTRRICHIEDRMETRIFEQMSKQVTLIKSVMRVRNPFHGKREYKLLLQTVDSCWYLPPLL